MAYFTYGAEFTAAGQFGGDPVQSEAIGLSGGKFAIDAYDALHPNTSHTQIFTDNGAAIIADRDTSPAPDVVLADGRYVAGTSTSQGISATFFDSSLAADGPTVLNGEHILACFSGFDSPTIEPLNSGGFVAVWDEFLPGSILTSAQIFNADGTAASQRFFVDTANFSTAHAAADLADGRLAIALTSKGTTRVYLFSPDGTPQGTPTVVGPSVENGTLQIASLPGGGFAVLRGENVSSGGAVVLHLQIFDAAGQPVSPDITSFDHIAALDGAADMAILFHRRNSRRVG